MPTPFPDPFSGFSTGLMQGAQVGLMMRQNRQADAAAQAEAKRKEYTDDFEMLKHNASVAEKDLPGLSQVAANNVLGFYKKYADKFGFDPSELPESFQWDGKDDKQAFGKLNQIIGAFTKGEISEQEAYQSAAALATETHTRKNKPTVMDWYKGSMDASKGERSMTDLAGLTNINPGLLDRIRANTTVAPPSADSPIAGSPPEEQTQGLMKYNMPQQQIDSTIQSQPESFEIGGVKLTPEQHKLLRAEVYGGKGYTEAMKGVMSLGGKEGKAVPYLDETGKPVFLREGEMPKAGWRPYREDKPEKEAESPLKYERWLKVNKLTDSPDNRKRFLSLLKAEEDASKKSDKEDKPEYKPGQALKRVTAIDAAVARLKSGGAVDAALAIQFPALAGLMGAKDERAVSAAIASLEQERDYLQEFVPEQYRKKEPPAFPAVPQGGHMKGPTDAPDAMQSTPPANQHLGRILENTETGKRYKSDGKNWMEIK